MNKDIYENNCYFTPYQSNGAFIFLYKSKRKNAKYKVLNIQHLINHTENRKISDANITNYFIGIIEKCVYICKEYKHIEISSTIDVFKNCTYKNANNDFYHCNKPLLYRFERKELHSFEQLINELFNIFCLVYPYNTIELKELYNDPSIRYFITSYYHSIRGAKGGV